MFVLLERGLKSLNMHLISRLMLVLKFLNIKVHRFLLELLCQAVLLQVKACVCVCVCVVFYFLFLLNRFLFCFIMIAIVMYFFFFKLKLKKKICGVHFRLLILLIAWFQFCYLCVCACVLICMFICINNCFGGF